jgi:hypothetical protein
MVLDLVQSLLITHEYCLNSYDQASSQMVSVQVVFGLAKTFAPATLWWWPHNFEKNFIFGDPLYCRGCVFKKPGLHLLTIATVWEFLYKNWSQDGWFCTDSRNCSANLGLWVFLNSKRQDKLKCPHLCCLAGSDRWFCCTCTDMFFWLVQWFWQICIWRGCVQHFRKMFCWLCSLQSSLGFSPIVWRLIKLLANLVPNMVVCMSGAYLIIMPIFCVQIWVVKS